MRRELILLLLLFSHCLFAQSDEQIIAEYQRWSGTRDDWPMLKLFQMDNASLSPATEQRVVFYGDSITQGWSDASPEFFANKDWVERGISGQTTAQMLVRFRQDVIHLEPQVVVILAGTNDLAGNTGPATNQMIQDNLASMAELAAAHDIQVIMSSIMPVDDYPWRPGLNPSPRIQAINQWLKEFCAAGHCAYLDYHSAMVNSRGGMQERYSYDGVHASKAGYTLMEEQVSALLTQVLSKNRD